GRVRERIAVEVTNSAYVEERVGTRGGGDLERGDQGCQILYPGGTRVGQLVRGDSADGQRRVLETLTPPLRGDGYFLQGRRSIDGFILRVNHYRRQNESHCRHDAVVLPVTH